eukprot:10265582-Ditylum_brightwellii.AAC.1
MDKGKLMHQKQINLIDAHIGLLNYSHDHQYSFKHWQNIVNVVIAKVVGCDKSIDFTYYIFMKQTTCCPLDSTGRRWLQQPNNGNSLTMDYMADVMAMMQKCFC